MDRMNRKEMRIGSHTSHVAAPAGSGSETSIRRYVCATILVLGGCLLPEVAEAPTNHQASEPEGRQVSSQAPEEVMVSSMDDASERPTEQSATPSLPESSDASAAAGSGGMLAAAPRVEASAGTSGAAPVTSADGGSSGGGSMMSQPVVPQAGSAGQASALDPLGHQCSDDAQCESGSCTDGVCCRDVKCDPCRRCGSDGLCHWLDNSDPERAARCAGAGETCYVDGHCYDGFCHDNVCCATATCDPCWSCNLPREAGHCAPVTGGQDRTGGCYGSCENGVCIDN